MHGQDAQAARCQHLLDEGDDWGDDGQFVDQIGGENHRHAQIVRRVAPVELQGAKLLVAIEPGVVGGEAQGAGIVIAERDLQSHRQGDDTGQAEAAADFERLSARRPVLVQDRLGQHARCRPKVGPVRHVVVLRIGRAHGGMFLQAVRLARMIDPVAAPFDEDRFAHDRPELVENRFGSGNRELVLIHRLATLVRTVGADASRKRR